MATVYEELVPDLGDFDDVEVIEVLVSVGQVVEPEDSLVTLETDKASMDIPATRAGKVVSVAVSVGDSVAQGTQIVSIEVADSDEQPAAPAHDETQVIDPNTQKAIAAAHAPEAARAPDSDATHTTQLVVIGAGPGGYTAAFRAADLGMDVVLVERWRCLVACVSTLDVSHPRLCCMPQRSLMMPRPWPRTASSLANQRSTLTLFGPGRTRLWTSWSVA